MKSIHLESLDRLDKDTALALGFFDGIHAGHQSLIQRVRERSSLEKTGSALFTFRRHPIEVLHPGLCFPYLTTQEEKTHLACKYGLEYYIDIDFTREFSIISPDSFVRNILFKKLRGRVFVVGRDYRFGFAAAGDVDFLRELSGEQGARVEVVDNVTTVYGKVSSTFIRESIMSGDCTAANLSLGRWYSIGGIVRGGMQRGRLLGVPTANLELPTMKVSPRPGVYCIFALADGVMYRGIGHIGNRPTFDESQYTLEIHLLDFSGDLYGKFLRVFFLKNLRETMRFPDAETLKVQISSDICACERYLDRFGSEEIETNRLLWSDYVSPVSSLDHICAEEFH